MTKTEERDALATRKPMNRPASHEEADERQEFLMLDVEFFTKDNEPVLFEHLTPESLRESERLQVINGAIIDVRDREDTANYVRLGQVIDHRLRMWEQAQPIGSRSSGAPPTGFASWHDAYMTVADAITRGSTGPNDLAEQARAIRLERDALQSAVSGAPREWRTNAKITELRKRERDLLLRVMVTAEVQEMCEETEGLDAETLHNARSNALDAVAQHEYCMDQLCEAVASALIHDSAVLRASRSSPTPATFDDGIRAVRVIRCLEHRNVPQFNQTEITGAECGACVRESQSNEAVRKALTTLADSVSNAPLANPAMCEAIRQDVLIFRDREYPAGAFRSSGEDTARCAS